MRGRFVTSEMAAEVLKVESAGPPFLDRRPNEAEVHLWLLDLAAGDPGVERLRESLDPEERARADRFRFAPDRNRFLFCRAALRHVLGRCLGVAPERLRLSAGAHGRPRLKEGQSDLDFNLSHSGDWGLLALASGRRVGVDIERIDASRAGDEIAARFFSPEEVEALRRTRVADRVDAFFRCWTRKEAYVKARGEGLSIPLDSFAVSIEPEASRLLRSDRGPEEVARWEVLGLRVVQAYAAAVAVEGTGWRPRLGRFPASLLGLS